MLTRSDLPGISWPGIPGGHAATLAALTYQFEQTQFYTPEQLVEHQCRQLGVLFRHAAEQVPFYRDWFSRADVDPRADVTPETIRRLPILTRNEFQNTTLSTSAGKFPDDHGKAYPIKTSGSTGRPVVLSKTTLNEFFWLAGELRGHLWHGRDAGGKLAVIRWLEKPKAMAPAGLEGKSWGPPLDMLCADTGPIAILNIASKLADQTEWLIRQNPDYLLSYPSNLLALAVHFERHGLELPKLRQICTVSEVVTNELRETVRRVWGVPVVDQYSCEEIGYLAQQCPEHDHYHVQSESLFMEVVDETGAPCPPGQSGRIVATSLHNFATPLIRYEVGDFAEPGEPCPCGRGLPVLSRILGRYRNRLRLPNGDSEFPYLGEHHDYNAITTAVRQFQYIQRGVDEVEKKMVVTEPLSPEQERKMKELIVKCLGHPFRVTLTYHDEIPRSASGKFEEFISEV